MTRAEQESFEKFRQEIGERYAKEAKVEITIRAAFLAGYRAGFEAQHYEVDDGNRTD